MRSAPPINGFEQGRLISGDNSSQLNTVMLVLTITIVPVRQMACPARFERATYGLEGRCSIHLSYGQYVKLLYIYSYQA